MSISGSNSKVKYLILNSDAVFPGPISGREIRELTEPDGEFWTFRESIPRVLEAAAANGYRLLILKGEHQYDRLFLTSLGFRDIEGINLVGSGSVDLTSDNIQRILRYIPNPDPFSIMVDFYGTPYLGRGFPESHALSYLIALNSGITWMSLDEMFPPKEVDLDEEFPADTNHILVLFGIPPYKQGLVDRVEEFVPGFRVIKVSGIRNQTIEETENRIALWFNETYFLDYGQIRDGLNLLFTSRRFEANRDKISLVWLVDNEYKLSKRYGPRDVQMFNNNGMVSFFGQGYQFHKTLRIEVQF